MTTVLDIAHKLGVGPVCAAFGVARSTYYRERTPFCDSAAHLRHEGCRGPSARQYWM
jgi:hypothetical protein